MKRVAFATLCVCGVTLVIQPDFIFTKETNHTKEAQKYSKINSTDYREGLENTTTGMLETSVTTTNYVWSSDTCFLLYKGHHNLQPF